MIPNWFDAVDNALVMLKPGGVIGVVDFYVSRKYPPFGQRRHSLFDRVFWPLWFGHDGVRPNADHLPYLSTKTNPISISEEKARIPYLMGLRCPYYRFIGAKIS